MKYIAIIGSGPAGCYLADTLARKSPDIQVDVLDKLPTPFGLVRYGVAPDHQGTKAISRVLERALSRDNVAFYGHVDVGNGITIEELKHCYDAIVIATGASRDRALGIPGEDLPGVSGSRRFVDWYNSHPDGHEPSMHDVRSAVVIGNGNVSLDIARVLAKTPDEMRGSDLSPQVHRKLQQEPIETVHIVGRRGPANAKFTKAELAEFGKLTNARPEIAEPHLLEPAEAEAEGEAADIVALLSGFARGECASHDNPDAVRILFHFHSSPKAFEGEDSLSAVRFAREGRDDLLLPAELAVTCIGYEAEPCCVIQPTRGTFVNDDALIAEGLYVTGWAGRGPSGTIPTNRNEAKRLAQRLATDVTDHGREGGAALARLLRERGIRFTNLEDWKRIDQAEKDRADEAYCRYKFESVDEMIDAAVS